MACLLTAVALVAFRPWADRPFDTLDFSEFLPLLRDGEGLFGRTWGLTTYYLHEHGRLNVASYFALALKWTLLGPSPLLWQWARFAQIALMVGGIYLLFRRWSLGPVAAMAGASIFVASRVSGEAWTRMTMGEPLGMIFTVGALWLAWDHRRAPDPRGRAIAAGVLMVLAILAKEMMAGVLPVVWLAGMSDATDGPPGAPRWDAAGRRWLFWTGVPTVGAFLIVVLTAIGGGTGGFTSLYGSGIGRGEAFVELLLRPWYVQGQRPGWSSLWLPGNTLFLAMQGAGLALVWRDAEARRRWLWPALAAGALSLALAVLYVPWPYFNLYYAIPFLLGTAFLFGMAVERVSAQGRWGRLATLLAWAGVVGSSAPASAHAASYAIGLQRVNGQLAAILPHVANADRVVVARRDLAPAAWIGTGPTLRRYALVTGLATELPPARDRTCAEVGDLLQRGLGKTVVITYLHNCGPIPGASTRVIERYRYVWVAWGAAGVADDSVAADVVFTDAALTVPPR
jgi:hypothetical protein